MDSILSLTINPAPAQTVRVFVGRLEIVSPATVNAVETALASHNQKLLAKYYRFIEPIFTVVGERDPEKAKRLRELECACYAQVAQRR